MDIIPPQDIEAEKRVLGAVMVDETLFRKADMAVTDFYQEKHRKIWLAIENVPEINLVTITDKLRQPGQLEEIGGASYLSEIAGDAIFPYFNADIKILKDKAIRRQIMQKSMAAIRDIETAEIDDLIASLKISHKTNIEIISARKTSLETIKYLDILQNSENHLAGLSSGFIELDRKTGGFRPGELIIIAARPGMGKSVIKSNIAVQADEPVGIFEIEMALQQNGLRYLSSVGEVDHELMHLGKLNAYEYRKTLQAAADFAEMPIHQVFEYSLTVEKIAAITGKLVDDYGIKAVLIDYMQLIRATDKGRRREEQVSHMAGSLKGLAREFNIPVICLAQLNRACELRSPKKPIPMLSDLRESGSLEQEADMVIFLYRDDYYAKLQNRESKEPGIARLIIAKARNSKTGNVMLQWEGKYMKFRNLERGYDGQ